MIHDGDCIAETVTKFNDMRFHESFFVEDFNLWTIKQMKTRIKS